MDPPAPPTGDGFVTPAPVSPRGEPLADPWPRVAARLLDLACLFAIDVLIVVVIAGDVGDLAEPLQDVDAARFTSAVLGALLVSYAWEAVLTRRRGGTPFKLLFRLRVVGSTDGAPITWGQSSGRWALAAGLVVLPFLIGLLYLVSLVLLFSNPRRQVLWDQIAKTLVVRAAG
jgi:uncharacterized RDD family membrane protein YckC